MPAELNPTLNSLDFRTVLLAVLAHPQTQITFKHEEPGEVTISVTCSPSVENIILKGTILAYEALLKNMLYRYPGSPDGLDELIAKEG